MRPAMLYGLETVSLRKRQESELEVAELKMLSFMESQSESLKLFGPEDPLVAVAGEDLVLPCFIKPNTSAVDMTVEWFKLYVKDSSVHLYRDHEDRNEDQAQSYRGRTSLYKEELQKGNASLKLLDLRVSDEGKYKCLIEDMSRSDDITVHVFVKEQGLRRGCTGYGFIEKP
ncbi:hypothetical protein QTP86_004252 [Hemibagrus guttatus]|nr:hypothetical protein QTP86_004252 [Hemibagrus guttatus]